MTEANWEMCDRVILSSWANYLPGRLPAMAPAQTCDTALQNNSSSTFPLLGTRKLKSWEPLSEQVAAALWPGPQSFPPGLPAPALMSLGLCALLALSLLSSLPGWGTTTSLQREPRCWPRGSEAMPPCSSWGRWDSATDRSAGGVWGLSRM